MAPPTDEDPFPRRTATPATLLPWLVRMARDLPAQAALYAPRRALDPGLRERIMVTVSEVNGCRYSSWIHRGWAEMTGRAQSARDDVALAYAREAAETGRVPPSETSRRALERVFSPTEVRAIDAAIAGIVVSNLAGNTVDGLLARLTGARPRDPAAMAQEAAVVAAAAPLGVPLLAFGALVRQAARAMPPLEVVVPPVGEANIIVMMLGEMARQRSGLPLLRALGVGGLPFALGLRTGAMEATVRLSRSKLELANGVAPDVGLVIEGEPDALIAAATGDASIVSLINQGRIRASVPSPGPRRAPSGPSGAATVPSSEASGS